ncbi:MAG: DCC1-like thiol-disulfide oxidoreductase family protein [Candidatus Sulfotelmatobacter sp.]
MLSSTSAPIVLYDGVCGLCNRFVQFILRRDRKDVFRFASLQSALSSRILVRYNLAPSDLDTVYVVVNPELPDERLLRRSDAVLFVLKELSIMWRSTAFVLRLVPRFFRDHAYDALASRRYRIFGRHETCVIPNAQHRNRFLDL